MIHSADSALQACAERDTLMTIQTEQRAKAPGGDPEHEAEQAEHIGEDEGPAASAGSSERASSDPADNGEGSSSGLPPSSTLSGSRPRSSTTSFDDDPPHPEPKNDDAPRTVRVADYASKPS